MKDKKNNIEKLLENKEVVEKVVEVIPEYKRDSNCLTFPLEVIPKSFGKLSEKDREFIRKMIIRMNVKDIKKFFNDNIKIELSCYLEDLSINIADISKCMISILDKIVFNNPNQIKELKVKIIDVKADPYNDGRPFIGIVVRKWKDIGEE